MGARATGFQYLYLKYNSLQQRNESLSGYISCYNLEVIVEKTLHKENVNGGAIGSYNCKNDNKTTNPVNQSGFIWTTISHYELKGMWQEDGVRGHITQMNLAWFEKSLPE